LFYSTYFGE